MATPAENHLTDNKPLLADVLAFRAKATLFQLRRLAQDLFLRRVERYATNDALCGREVIAETSSPLWTQDDPAEQFLQAGKTHNLRLAVRRLNGVEVPAGAVFSFWAHVGQASRLRGYVRGRELREGCIIPGVGGGLCQLSNALYDAALRANFEIVERHAHTQVVPGSSAEEGRDATVFWNYVDLRFRSTEAFRIEASMSADKLFVRFRGERPARAKVALKQFGKSSTEMHAPNDCVSCGVLDCFRHVGRGAESERFGRTAFLVDEYWPEHDEYVRARRGEKDLLCVPLDGRRFGKPNYAWDTRGFAEVKERRLLAARRSFESRRLQRQGAERQRALLRSSERLAEGFASLVGYDATHLTVTQNLLPFLWRDGQLGGRTFDVLMTSLPVWRLHQRLDEAAAMHTESRTLADFRADARLVEAEREALACARRIVTPHTEIASLYEKKAVLLDWHVPRVERRAARGSRILFPAATVGRKGAYEMREAAEKLKLSIATIGAELEGENFWRGVRIEHRGGGSGWLDDVCAVVLPAFVEHRPRRLLEAVARGVPVIASQACGLANVEGVTSVAAGDVDALCAAIEDVLTATGTRVELELSEIR
ncbi:MAG TPA: VanW family protein [Pyrinomonadaceae bacterium]|jgi:glycosyltransferase involved in cell wall biosynthesis|nr:VanW family protein [Pyrinomonadaceae bacterium]